MTENKLEEEMASLFIEAENAWEKMEEKFANGLKRIFKLADNHGLSVDNQPPIVVDFESEVLYRDGVGCVTLAVIETGDACEVYEYSIPFWMLHKEAKDEQIVEFMKDNWGINKT